VHAIIKINSASKKQASNANANRIEPFDFFNIL
jgi:hypothetical protein